VVAHYLGDSTDAPATSAAATLRVAPKATPVVSLKTPKKVRVGHRPRIGVTVSATGSVPTGRVVVTAKQGKRTTVYTASLVNGKAVLHLKRPKHPGRIKVTVAYAGNAAVAAGSASAGIRVVRR
jgi:hypothetical protein